MQDGKNVIVFRKNESVFSLISEEQNKSHPILNLTKFEMLKQETQKPKLGQMDAQGSFSRNQGEQSTHLQPGQSPRPPPRVHRGTHLSPRQRNQTLPVRREALALGAARVQPARLRGPLGVSGSGLFVSKSASTWSLKLERSLRPRRVAAPRLADRLVRSSRSARHQRRPVSRSARLVSAGSVGDSSHWGRTQPQAPASS